MKQENWKQALQKERFSYLEHVSMQDYTTLHIGGYADFLFEPSSLFQIMRFVSLCKREQMPFVVLGKGSNVLVDDEGFHGAILHLGNNFAQMTHENNSITVQSGALLKDIANYACKLQLKGFEFACGIPGSAGGAVIMNAGAYGKEMNDIIQKVQFLDEHNQLITFTKEELQFSYRNSYFSSHFGIIVSITYQLKQGKQSDIANKMAHLMELRYQKQPMSNYSAGSTFKRPKYGFASKLIQEANLQGTAIGDAQVSHKHAGFLINHSHATSHDFHKLIQLVQKTVYEQSGIHLECEIKFIPAQET